MRQQHRKLISCGAWGQLYASGMLIAFRISRGAACLGLKGSHEIQKRSMCRRRTNNPNLKSIDVPGSRLCQVQKLQTLGNFTAPHPVSKHCLIL
eukprot:1138781-Pelagomonas_calceolata.AAC.4